MARLDCRSGVKWDGSRDVVTEQCRKDRVAIESDKFAKMFRCIVYRLSPRSSIVINFRFDSSSRGQSFFQIPLLSLIILLKLKRETKQSKEWNKFKMEKKKMKAEIEIWILDR